jgi:hypothetical protein
VIAKTFDRICDVLTHLKYIEGEKNRWGFEGEPAPEMHRYMNTSVAHLFKKGNASPAMYTFNVKDED